MKKIEAVIQRSKLGVVQHALGEIGVDGMTVCEVQGFARQNRHTESYRGSEFTVDSLPKIRIDFVVADPEAEQAVNIIIKLAKMGKSGDDKVLISNVEEVRYEFAI